MAGESSSMSARRIVVPLLLAIVSTAAAAIYLTTGGREVSVASFATSLDGRTPAQRANALRAAAAIDGAVVPPGGVFSFNGRVGSLSKDRGYLKAPVSFDGELVPSFGGGVCQTSTTLYNAALLAGMAITERHRHVWPPAYAAHGDDAAVAYPRYDLAFTNPLGHPVRISCGEQGRRLLCGFHAARRPAERYEVQRKVRSVEPAPRVRQASTGSVAAARRLIAGRPGFSVTTYRLTRRGGEIVARQMVAEDSYRPLPEVIQTSVDPGDMQ